MSEAPLYKKEKEWSPDEVWTRNQIAEIAAEVSRYSVGNQFVDKETGEILTVQADPDFIIAHFSCRYTYQGSDKIIEVPTGEATWSVVYRKGVWAELINQNKLLSA